MSLLSCPKTASFLAITVFSVLLSACGGGAPSVDTRTSPVFQVSVNRAALRFDGEEGRGVSPAVVLGTGTGTTPDTIYTGSLDLGTFLDRVTAEVVGAQIKFTVYPKPTLVSGTYSGSVQLFACADAKCLQHFSGSPVTVPYTIVIAKGFNVSPQSLSLTALSGNIVSREISVQLPLGQTSFTLSSSAQWLKTENVNANGFTLTTLAMPPGNYNGILSVSIAGRNLDIPVNYVVSGDASTVTKMSTDVTSFNFNALAGAGTVTRNINVTLPSWTKELKAEIIYGESGQTWLSLAKTGIQSYALYASSLNLNAGKYSANLLLGSGPTVAPISIPITFVVGAPTWTIVGNTNYLIDSNTKFSQLSSEIAIDVPGLPALAWSASANSSWLKLLNSSGMTGVDKLRVAVDSAALLKMANFSEMSSEVTISADGNKFAPQKVKFSINKRLAQINFASPSIRLPNEAGTVIIRGRGFDGITNLDQALKVSGAPIKRITRTNDTQLVLDLDGIAQGETNITLSNGLDVATGTAKVKVVPPVTFGYRAIPTQGAKGAIHFDAERQSIYTTNKTLGSVMRFAHVAGSWTILTASIPSIDSAAMSPDRSSLVTTSKNGKLNLVDPTSLATQATYSAASDFIAGEELNSLPRLAITNNGKAYFQSRTWSDGLTYFDLTTREFGSLKGGYPRFSFYSGPWFSVSGDGDRLIIVQSASISSRPTMLYMNASDEIPKDNPAGIDAWYEAAQSLHGERFAEGTYKVWDHDFNLIGNVTLPSTGKSYGGRTPVFSPDGSRLYVLAYPYSLYQGTPDKPRVFVIDTSTKLVTTTSLPVLGYFDLADYPTCSNSDYGCNTRALGTISPDGKTLFFIGDANLIVAPIPTLQTVKAAAGIQRANVGGNVVPDTMIKHESRTR